MLSLFVTPAVSLCILFALFAEPRVGKMQAKRREEDSRSCRNHRPDAAAVAGATT